MQGNKASAWLRMRNGKTCRLRHLGSEGLTCLGAAFGSSVRETCSKAKGNEGWTQCERISIRRAWKLE